MLDKHGNQNTMAALLGVTAIVLLGCLMLPLFRDGPNMPLEGHLEAHGQSGGIASDLSDFIPPQRVPGTIEGMDITNHMIRLKVDESYTDGFFSDLRGSTIAVNAADVDDLDRLHFGESVVVLLDAQHKDEYVAWSIDR